MKALIWEYKANGMLYAECPICGKRVTLHPVLAAEIKQTRNPLGNAFVFIHTGRDHDQIVPYQEIKWEQKVYPGCTVMMMEHGTALGRIANRFSK